MLEFSNVSVKYGAIEAIRDVSFTVKKGEIVTLIGSNGAGKTTTLRATSGLVKPATGKITYNGETISGLAPHEIVRKRISQAPEGRGIFLNLSVEENLDLGAWTAPDKTTLQKDLEYSFELFPRLKERRKQNAGTLSGGEQQMLAIARALMAHPDMLLLDEPSLGLRRRSSSGSSRSSRRSTKRARPSCSSSRTPCKRCRSRIKASCSRRARSCSKAPRSSSSRATKSARLTSENELRG